MKEMTVTKETVKILELVEMEVVTKKQHVNISYPVIVDLEINVETITQMYAKNGTQKEHVQILMKIHNVNWHIRQNAECLNVIETTVSICTQPT